MLFFFPDISPFVGNLLVTALIFIYIFGLLAFMNFCVTHWGLPQDISRKIAHIAAGSVIIFWPLYSDLHWSKYLNITIFVLWFGLLIYKGFFAHPDDETVKIMTRTGDKSELLKGPLYFVIVATICGLIWYKAFPGIVAMACLGWGDGFAPIIGSRYGKWKYTILSNKSVEGSLTMFLFAFAASVFFVWLILPSELNISRILLLALIATFMEAFSPKEADNILIPVGVIAAANFV